ncbi:transposase [Lewinella aquimaris]|uniref:Transposase n=1 Tax=Neolewinella aquimaris TaxID=1835722 RepID=A0A840E7M5_9BACT|nr:IS110 family transposase [Neolewinella aquimaris]MBB4081161.1 transposase [Neolewinella aquimaris]
MDFAYYVGWDVSKASLNFCIRDPQQSEPVQEGQVANTPTAIGKLLRQWSKRWETDLAAFAHCVENTGRYTYPLLGLVEPLGLHLWMEDPLQLKRSMGRQKRKTDAVDARNIAEYCRWKHERATWYTPPSALSLHLRELSHSRTKLVRMRQSLHTSHRAKEAFALVPPNAVGQRLNCQLIEAIDQQLAALDLEILRLIEADERARRKLEIARSVPGIGPKNVVVILAITGLFERIASARACAAYAGLVPYEFQSGTSIHRRSRVSRAVSKPLKTALHQGAQFLIMRPSPFKELYDRLRAKGRTYRQAINAVRNKMIRVLYTCLKKDVTYDKKVHAGLA